MDGEYLTTTFGSPVEAELARAFLASHDIPCRIVDDFLVGVAMHMESAFGGVKLYVSTADAQEAARLLDEHFRSLKQVTRVETPADCVSRALRTAIVGFFIFPVVMHVWSALQLADIQYSSLDSRSRSRYWAALSINAVVFLTVSSVVYWGLNAGRP
jgi:hypothetical protein